LRGGRYVAVDGEVAEKSLDVFRRKFAWMALSGKYNVSSDPVDVGLFGA
jgi:hypothetical protein